jgi:hypothetical protein
VTIAGAGGRSPAHDRAAIVLLSSATPTMSNAGRRTANAMAATATASRTGTGRPATAPNPAATAITTAPRSVIGSRSVAVSGIVAAVQLEFIKRCAALDGAALGEGAFGPGPAVWVGTREVAHFDHDRTLDVRLTKAVIRARRAELKPDNRVSLRKSSSDWLEVTIGSQSDATFALGLVQDAVAANRPTAKPGLPPTGAALARRRRFH